MSKFLLVILVFILLSSFKGIFRNLVAELKKKKYDSNQSKDSNSNFASSDIQDADFEDID
tara:strand:- start:273 stop:452 length:180 start_codon:yes stop_codon:yes gene_type:complete